MGRDLILLDWCLEIGASQADRKHLARHGAAETPKQCRPPDGEPGGDQTQGGILGDGPKTTSERPRLLDLFSGAGGIAAGYARAGFEVIGIDIERQPNYPFEYLVDDAVELLRSRDPEAFSDFDAIHASPPCQRYMTGGTHRKDHPDLVGIVRTELQRIGLPWVIENVPGAHLRRDLLLCGSQFGLPIRRHRIFETSPRLASLLPSCDHSKPIVGVYGNPHGERGAWPGMLPSTKETWSAALGIDWMTARELAQAIPPAYGEHIGMRLLSAIKENRPRSPGGGALTFVGTQARPVGKRHATGSA